MKTFSSALLVGSAAAMPLLYNESTICEGGACEKPDMKYERIATVQPGYQWDDAGGYCGSWATQRNLLAHGAWISQQQVRDHTTACGGNDNEILSCNIEEAWTNLKVSYEAFNAPASDKPLLRLVVSVTKDAVPSDYPHLGMDESYEVRTFLPSYLPIFFVYGRRGGLHGSICTGG